MNGPTALGTPILTSAALADIVDGIAASNPVASIPAGTDRRWVLVAATDAYDVWAIAWPAGCGLGMHDHDGSTAAVRVVAGELRERYVAEGDRHGSADHDGNRRRGVTTRWLAEGSTTLLAADHIHEVVNVGTTEAVSVHAYSPPIGEAAFRDDPALDVR